MKDIRYLKGVGEKRAGLLNKLGIFTIEQLLEYYPRDYRDFSREMLVSDCESGENACIKATLISSVKEHMIRRGMTLYKCDFTDGNTVIHATLFNQKFLAKSLKIYEDYILFGKIEKRLSFAEMSSPQILPAKDNAGIHPIYRATEKLSSAAIEKLMKAALEQHGEFAETLPRDIRQKYGLIELTAAMRNIHFPESFDLLAAARKRLIFEELLILQLGLLKLKSKKRRESHISISHDYTADFLKLLPFKPTGAQLRAVKDCVADMQGKYPMNRLLQGDVGSGKTLVAAAAIWFAAQNGWQSAMLAPTEILARQHAANLADRLEPFGVNVTLLVGGMKAAEKRVALAAIADGRAGLVVGTHAVLTDSVVFKNLGLAIVDEQHRFGVRQRGILAGKANNPHLLVMSATPIPRTLGLLMYGDLDISILDELPPGRKPIKTWFITGKKRRDMYGFLEKQIAAGHQVYIVCPAIEENEMDSGMKAVKQYYEQVACPLLPGRRIGLLHGKMKPKDKDEVMQQFKAGELDVLVSTTVIEVGVDVPNATVMVIENAERFGLSALHQLRGRVGRGAANSCCILISDNEGEAVRQRLHFLCRTSDGFAVAKYDLETRGPGDFFGEAQHGLPTLHVADLVQDTRTLTVAQQEAKALLALDPNLAKPEHKALSDEVERLFATAGAMN